MPHHKEHTINCQVLSSIRPDLGTLIISLARSTPLNSSLMQKPTLKFNNSTYSHHSSVLIKVNHGQENVLHKIFNGRLNIQDRKVQIQTIVAKFLPLVIFRFWNNMVNMKHLYLHKLILRLKVQYSQSLT